MANHPELIAVAISCDSDDGSMTRNLVRDEVMEILKPVGWKHMYFSENKSKIQACNADMEKIDCDWQIVVLVSDDMIPCVQGYDDVIRMHMMSHFPALDGALWFNDGHQGENLNTLSIMGRKLYESFGYIYQPSYISLFCDNEYTDFLKESGKYVYIPHTIIQHEHFTTTSGVSADELYMHNQTFLRQDMYNYIARKRYAYDWSILILTIKGREESVMKLLHSIREKQERVCPEIRLEIRLAYDNREATIGAKRQRLLQAAKGKYVCFVDDDDELTDAYFRDAAEAIRGEYHVLRLVGSIHEYPFIHSIENSIYEPMAKEETFLRPPNHLNVMMADIARRIRFQDISWQEDQRWAYALARNQLLTKEYPGGGDTQYIYKCRNPVYPQHFNDQSKRSLHSYMTESPKAGVRLTTRGFVSG